MYRQLLQNICREASFPLDGFGPDHFVLSQAMIGELREMSYFERWKKSIQAGWYHVKMQDSSLFLFTEGDSPSYSYLHCPLELITFPEFIADMREIDTPGVRRALRSEYQKVIDTASPRECVTPIRFDYDPNGYSEGVHPVSHIHIGLDNDVRLSSNKMTSVSFVLFVMRHMYPSSWRKLLQRPDRAHLVSSIRAVTAAIPDNFWKDLDRVELHLR